MKRLAGFTCETRFNKMARWSGKDSAEKKRKANKRKRSYTGSAFTTYKLKNKFLAFQFIVFVHLKYISGLKLEQPCINK